MTVRPDGGAPDGVQLGELDAWLGAWAAVWGTPQLLGSLDIRFSRRLRRTLGRCRPATGRITLSTALLDGPRDRLAEVLCHEAAHVVVQRRHGRRARSHGPEWRALVRAAGFEPRARAAGGTINGDVAFSGAWARTGREPIQAQRRKSAADEGDTRARGLRYEHRCPVCHTVHYSRRRGVRWRCAECMDAGLPVEMVATAGEPHRSQSSGGTHEGEAAGG